ncbi:hypothetical protein [Lysinibacillus endophyticus]|uniref:hypothetical protein n=1 Tax=Ureibacillus endophyticus TaxID=1978490 RepID=UPI00209DB726|nr:hypothetical protein [Lysinibacillus endophyticus]MCP1145265.1 hypothetical protein [Lysinibacillus endophyticus]
MADFWSGNRLNNRKTIAYSIFRNPLIINRRLRIDSTDLRSFGLKKQEKTQEQTYNRKGWGKKREEKQEEEQGEKPEKNEGKRMEKMMGVSI